MKAINKRYDRTCMVLGYYDYGDGGEYRELVSENFELSKLDKSIKKHIYLNHDITIHIVPGVEIRVFAKNLKDIQTYLEVSKNLDDFKTMLDCFSEYNKSVNGEYIYTTIDIEEFKREIELDSMEF